MASMSRKTYAAVAEVFAGVAMPDRVREELIAGMSRVFREDNPRFDAVRFARAASPPEVFDSVVAEEV